MTPEAAPTALRRCALAVAVLLDVAVEPVEDRVLVGWARAAEALPRYV